MPSLVILVERVHQVVEPTSIAGSVRVLRAGYDRRSGPASTPR
jgi:hypothetical protein